MRAPAAVTHSLFARQHQRQVCQRRQIATRSDAALRRYKWLDLAIQQLAQRFDHDRPHTRMPFGERIRPQQHHGARLRSGQRFAYTHCVRAQQIHLQFANLFRRDADVAEFPNSGGDAVRNPIAGNQRVYDFACPQNNFSRFRVELHGGGLRPHPLRAPLPASGRRR